MMTTSQTYKRGDEIPLAEAAKMLADRNVLETDKHKAAKNPAYQRCLGTIKRAVKAQKLLPCNEQGTAFKIEVFADWARSLNLKEKGSMRDKFNGLPEVLQIGFECTVPVPACEFDIVATSESLDVANRKWAECQREIEELKAEIERLRPLAEAKQRQNTQNRQNGGKRGK